MILIDDCSKVRKDGLQCPILHGDKEKVNSMHFFGTLYIWIISFSVNHDSGFQALGPIPACNDGKILLHLVTQAIDEIRTDCAGTNQGAGSDGIL